MIRIILTLFILLTGVVSRADSPSIYDLPKFGLVMNKKYDITSKFTAQLGYLPLGAFNKYIGVGGSYVKLFTDSHGWEVANVIVTSEVPSKLQKALISSFGATKEDFVVMKGLVTSNYYYSPYYTKSLLFNSKLIYSQLSFIFGGGVAIFNVETVPTGSFGIVQKFFFGEKSSISFDARYYGFLTNRDNIRSQASLMAVFSFGLGKR